MNESESNHQTDNRDNKLPGTNAGESLKPGRDINPDGTDDIEKASGAPKPAEIVIFSSVILAFIVFLSWQRCRAFLDAHAGSVSAIATLAIMILTAFYVVYARSQWEAMEGQLRQMARSATQTERLIVEATKSADAAKASTDAYMNGERPWVIPKIRKIVKWVDTVSLEEETLGKPIRKRYVYFTFRITNHGRTPAEIVGIRGNPNLTTKGINGGLEDPPDYGLEYIFMQVRLLAPGQHWDYHDVDLDFRWVDESTRKDLDNFKLHRMFKGVVLYRDVFKPAILHESRFCYTYFYKAEDYLPSGPPDHTKYT